MAPADALLTHRPDLRSTPESGPRPGPEPGVVRLWFVRPQPARSDRLARLLGGDELARAARFRVDADRTSFITLHAAARLLLADIAGMAPASLPIRRAPGGKPWLEGTSGLHFSLSRTRGMALIGLAMAPLGVDIEAIRPIEDAQALADRFFAPREAAALALQDGPARDDAFFASWSRKEAVVKAIGLGLTKPLDSFEIDMDPARPALLSMDGERDGAASWSLWGRPFETCWAAVAAPWRRMDVRPAILDLSAWG